MVYQRGVRPPLSPLLIAGMAARPLPPQLLNAVLSAAMAITRRRHPDFFERLATVSKPTYLIDPVDMPLAFALSLDADNPSLRAVRNGAGLNTAATVRGPLPVLLALLQGDVDGDALFFNRELTIEGDTEVVVALRNAIESIEVDILEDLLAELGPLARPARRVADIGLRLYRRADRDLARLQRLISGYRQERTA